MGEAVLSEALAAIGWEPDDLDPAYPPHVAFAGNDHLVLGVTSLATLAGLDYDFDRLAELMRQEQWTTVHLFFAEGDGVFHVRNAFPPGGVVEDPATGAAAAAFGGYLRSLGLVALPARLTLLQGFHVRNAFPPGGVVEDPATGAAAAAFGGYLRSLGLVPLPTRLTLLQGRDMGRPSRLLVDLDPDTDTVRVSGSATRLPRRRMTSMARRSQWPGSMTLPGHWVCGSVADHRSQDVDLRGRAGRTDGGQHAGHRGQRDVQGDLGTGDRDGLDPFVLERL